VKKIKLFLDEDIHTVLSTLLQKRGFDAVHAQEIGRKGRSDEEQLVNAVAQNRCLVSFNIKDFVRLHNDYIQSGWEHCGIIVSKQIPIGETLRRLLVVLQLYSQDSIRNRLLFLRK